jgi:hypothetical protein
MSFPLLFALALAPQEPQARQEVLALSSRGIDAFLVDFKDQGLHELVRLIEPRLAELSTELAGQVEIPPALFRIAGRALLGPVRIQLSLPSESDTVQSPVLGRIELTAASEAAARALVNDFGELLGEAGLHVAPAAGGGLAQVQGSPVPAWIGTEGSRCVIAVGAADAGAGTKTRPVTAEEPAFVLALDYGAFLRRMIAMSGAPEGEQRRAMSMFEALGSARMRLSMETRIEEGCSRTISIMASAGKSMHDAEIFPEEALPMSVLDAVPADALWAQVVSLDLGAYLDFIVDALGEELASSGIDDPIETIDQMTGFHLHRDLLDNLGTSFGVYASDSTGASGCSSIVMFASLRNAAGFAETLQRLEDLIATVGASETGGRIAVRPWKSGETDYRTLVFPGFPVPLELTWAIAGDRFVLGATPQAALAAVRQIQHPEASLAQNPRFAQQLPADRQGMQGIQFLDTRRLLRSGYAPMSLLCSALTNATRSPADASRDAGLVMPPYPELERDARAMVSITRIRGDDVVQEVVADRSFLVDATGLAGFLIEGPLLPIVGLTGLASARLNAEIPATRNEPEDH